MPRFQKDRLIFGGLLLALIAIGEIVLHELYLPAVFVVMLFFFLAHMDRKVAPNIIIGALAGIGCTMLAKPVVGALAPITGLSGGRLVYLLNVVGLIILFRETAPVVFNDYLFAFFLISGLAAKTYRPRPDPFVWMAVTLVGGTIIILGILTIRKIVAGLARKRAIAAARLRLPAQ